MTNTLMVMGIGVLILAFVALAFASPVFLIWSINLLFGLTIPVSFKTYLAAMFLLWVVTPKSLPSKQKS